MKTSETIANLVKALTVVQGKVKNPAKTATNPAFKSKYSPLDEILSDANRKLLTDNGLFLTQWVEGSGDTVSVHTLMAHESGEYIQYDPLTIKCDKPTAQGAGSAITYARRYTVSSILGVCADDDDDGNAAQPKIGARPNRFEGLYLLASEQGITVDMVKKVVERDYKKTIDKLSPEELTEVETRLKAPKQPKA
jgi:hypothetical protein